MPRCFSESNPGVLAAEAEGSGGRDGGDEDYGAQERDEDVAHSRQSVALSNRDRKFQTLGGTHCGVIRERRGRS